ncbi:MAG: hypothetical protein ACR2QW_15130 [bacterium]
MKLFIIIISLSILLMPIPAFTVETPVPKNILGKIRAKAETDSPGNRSVQETQVKSQIEAYRKIQTYENKQVPVTVIDRIRVNMGLTHPYDYTTQLFFMNQQVNSYLKMGLMSSHLFAAKLVTCEDLKWKLAVKGKPAVYRGRVNPGTVDVIYVEVRNSRGLIGQNFGFPNPGGTWEVMVWGDYHIIKRHREKFLCEKY